MKAKKLVIVGDGEFAEIAYEYFTHDSEYEVVGFAVEKDFLKKDTFYDLPVVPLEEIEKHFSQDKHYVFTAITFTKLNRVRARLYNLLKSKNYKFATYISSKAFVWKNATIGENCFIFENNVVQHHVSIGNNVVLWSGSFIGHRAKIQDNCFVAPKVSICGYVEVGKNCFVGSNSTLVNNIIIGDDCFIAANCLIKKSMENSKMCLSQNTVKISKNTSLEYFNVGPI